MDEYEGKVGLRVWTGRKRESWSASKQTISAVKRSNTPQSVVETDPRSKSDTLILNTFILSTFTPNTCIL